MKSPPGKIHQVAALLLLLVALPGNAQNNPGLSLEQGGRILELDISTQYEPAMQGNLQRWVEFISNALLQVYGHWPRERWKITVAPVSASSADLIPWAQVHRDKVDSVEFFTAAHATTEQLNRAWTGYHELSHLLIPYQGWGDAWFSEGLASYYQNILQARAGVLSEQEMWQKLYDGYQRGQADSAFNGQSLQLISDNMRSNGGFMRVYWSGAWYFMTADIRLRQQSGGRNSLDKALAKLNQCCSNDPMSAPVIARKLDDLNQVLLFQPLFEQVSASRQVPDFEPIFASMGITISGDKVVLQNEGPGAKLRRQIAARKAL